MKQIEIGIKLGMVAALASVKSTLEVFRDGMTEQDIASLIEELDQQLAVKNTEIELLKA